MAAKRKAPDELTGKQIVDLAASITSTNMELFAKKYLEIERVTVENIKEDSRKSSQRFNDAVIHHWKNKNPDDQVQSLADLLYDAARHHSLVDPRKVEEILGVPRPQIPHPGSRSTPDQEPTVDEEFKNLAKSLKKPTKREMKIEVAPWIQDYAEDMDDLYCELALEKVKKKHLREEREPLKNYDVLFEETVDDADEDDGDIEEGRKILIKADPGMGKTTLGKRIAYDWASEVFTKMSLVLFVFLKLVNPSDAIENVIIDQNTTLKGMGVTADRLKTILKTFGSTCLLILDGMDEHAQGLNTDVIDIIKGVKCLNCNLILTSRPHSTLKYEKHFDTIVRVDGFTESEARKFATKLLEDETLVEDVLTFNPSGRGYGPLYRCPILLSFLLILINEEGVEALDTDIEKGEIYAKLISCLYKKYAIKKNKEFKEKELPNVLKSVGKLAYETLLSGDPLMKRSQVVSEVGEDVFDYGLLIGNEDHRIVITRDADIVITFPHRSLQEILGSFYYIWMLSEGHSIESLLRSGDEEPFFMDNPLFMEFCVWFLFNSEFEPFVLPRRDAALSAMSKYVADEIDKEEPVLRGTSFPGQDIEASFRDGKKLMQEFFEKALEKCCKTKRLAISAIIPLDWVVGCLKKEPSASITHLEHDKPEWLPSPESLFQKQWPELEILKLLDANITDSEQVLAAIEESQLPSLVGATLGHDVEFSEFDGSRVKPSVRVMLSEAVACQLWDRLKKLGFRKLSLDKCRKLPYKFLDQYLQLVQEVMYNSTYFEKVVEATIRMPNLRKFQYRELTHTDLMSLARAKAGGKLTDLKLLDLTGSRKISGNISALFSHAWLGLEKLNLSRCDLKPEDLMSLVQAKAEGKLPDLKVLDLWGSKQISGNLSALVSRAWLGLEKLDLMWCNLKHEDLTSLARAKAEGKLPDLKVLYLKGNRHISGNLSALVTHAWLGLEELNLSRCDLKPKDFTSLAEAKAEGKLPDLKSLDLNTNKQITGAVSTLFSHAWPGLEELKLWGPDLKPEDHTSLARAKADGKSPHLKYLNWLK